MSVYDSFIDKLITGFNDKDKKYLKDSSRGFYTSRHSRLQKFFRDYLRLNIYSNLVGNMININCILFKEEV